MIEVRNLSKHYKVHRREPGLAAAVRSVFKRRYEEVKAVEGIDFSVGAGERVGFLGPNGAGKTTTLKVLAGLLHPTAGEVKVGGHLPQRRERAFLEKITLVMGQKQQLIWDLPPAETFALNRAIYDIPRSRFEETIRTLSDLLELGDLVGKPARQLSLGERMKCELAAALIHRPQILFLDEPTIGLDVSMQATVRSFVKSYNEQTGATVILTSHYMDDVVALCPRVVVIDHGQLSYDGDLRSLSQKVKPDKRVVLRLGREVDREDLTRFGQVVSSSGTQAVVQVAARDVSEAVGRMLAALPIVDLTVEDPPLEEVMRELFKSSRDLRRGGCNTTRTVISDHGDPEPDALCCAVPYFSPRLPHVVTRTDLAFLVAPTYAAAHSVEEDDARERVARALERPGVAEDLYRSLSAGLEAAKGSRTTEDELMDKLSAGVQKRRARAKPAPATPALSAVMVRINLEIGFAPESMRATLTTDKGRALFDEGLRVLGTHLVKDLLR